MNRLTIEERRRIYLAQQRTRLCEPDPIPKLSGPSPRPRTGEGSGGGPAAHAVTPGRDEDVMGRTCSLDRQIVRAFQALLLERRAKLRESVRARIAERQAGEPRRSPEDATHAVESLGEELEVAMLDRESREAAQIDAALERLARDEYGICRSCGTVIGLRRLKARS